MTAQFWRLSACLLGLAVAAVASVPLSTGTWPDGAIPIAPELLASAPNQNVNWNVVASDAMASWNRFLQRVQLQPAGTSGTWSYDNGRSELFFSPELYDEPFPSGVLAATLITSDKGEVVEADVVFSKSTNWGRYDGVLKSGVTDFRRVALHELGHVLGLGHPDLAGQTVTAIMNSTVSSLDFISQDDEAGVRSLYDANRMSLATILSAPLSTSVTEGASAKLRVTAGGRGPFTYAWQHDGTVIPGATESTLQIEVVTLEGAGSYRAAITNPAGTMLSAPAQLTVSPAQSPSAGFSHPSGQVNVGEDYWISATSSGSFPLKYEWFKGGQFLGATTSAGWSIKDAQLSDAGDYTLRLTNIRGTTSTGVFHLDVFPSSPPVFLTEPFSGTVPFGATAKFAPSFTAGPNTTALWRKNGVIIPGATNTQFSIYSCKPSDTGVYTLTLTNNLGEATSGPGLLNVQPPSAPEIVHQPAPTADFPGRDFQISGLSYTGTGTITSRWFKDGVPLPDDYSRYFGITGTQPIIRSVTLADSGLYSCVLTNEYGSTTSMAVQIDVLAPRKPVITQQPSARHVVPGATVSIPVVLRPWFANKYVYSNYSGYTYQWFKDNVPVPGQTTATLAFTAQPGDEGTYFVRVGAGSLSTDSNPAHVTIDSTPAILPMHPPSLLVDSGDSEVLRLFGLSLTIWVRRNVVADSIEWKTMGGTSINLTGGYPILGTFRLIATKNGVSEQSEPFVIDYEPADIPVLTSQPSSQTVDNGDSIDLWVNAVARAPVTYQWKHNGQPISGATDYHYLLSSFSAADAGTYTVTATSAAGSTTSTPAVLALRPPSPPVISSEPVMTTTTLGMAAQFEVSASGGTLHYQWLKDGVPLPGATESSLLVMNSSSDSRGAYSVVVTNGSASVTSRSALLALRATNSPPEIVLDPHDLAVPVGGRAVLSVGAFGDPLPTSYRWQKDGVDVPGAIDPELRLPQIRLSDAGSYVAIVSNAFGSATSHAARLVVDPAGRLANISSRARVGTGADILIAGFVVNGAGPRQMLVRGIGAQLADFGVAGNLRNPTLKVFDAAGALVAQCTDWFAGDEYDGVRNDRIAALQAAAAKVGAFPLRTDTVDAALLTTLQPGLYTAQVSGAANTTGIGLVEVYEVDSPASTRVVNLSCRSFVGQDASILIAGLVVSGEAPRRLLLRGAGPALTRFGVTGVLEHPVLRLFKGSEVLAENTGWDSPDKRDAIAAASSEVGAFAFADGSRDAALLLDLPPGVYTIQISGEGDTTGVALAEAYEVPN